MPEMFGKRYEWDMVDGRLSLVKPWYVAGEIAPVAATYADLQEALRKIEADGYWDSWGWNWWAGGQDASGEGAGRISLGQDGNGVSDSEAGRDAGRGDRGQQGFVHGALAREEGAREEGLNEFGFGLEMPRVCNACIASVHGICAGPRHCACVPCLEGELG